MSRESRKAASRKYRPDNVALLLVAEAPPQAPDRYFYFEQVASHDWLFRAVVKALFGEGPKQADKPHWLRELKKSGVYLIDASEDPVSSSSISTKVPDLVRRVRRLKPKCVMLITATVYDHAFASLQDGGLPVVDVRIPFPSAGWQRQFHRRFKEGLRSCARLAGSG